VHGNIRHDDPRDGRERLRCAQCAQWRRLPSVAELVALVDLTRTSIPYIDLGYFPGTPADGATQYHYWSSTTAPNSAYYLNLLNFSIPQIAGMDTKGNANNGTTYYYLARCVSGPLSPAISLTGQRFRIMSHYCGVDSILNCHLA